MKGIREARTCAPLVVAAALAFAGCDVAAPDDGGCGPGIGQGGGLTACLAPRVALDPPERERVLAAGGLEPGGSIDARLELRNAGFGPLVVIGAALEDPIAASGPAAVVVAGTSATEVAVSGAAFSLVSLPPLPLEIAPLGTAAGDALPITIRFTAPASYGASPSPLSATLVLRTDDPFEPEVRVSFSALSAPPALRISPAAIDLGLVPAGEEASRTVSLLNTGGAGVLVGAISLEGDPRFSVAPPAEGLPFFLDASTKVDLEVLFDSADGSPAEARLVVHADPAIVVDPAAEADLVANREGPCLAVDPGPIVFGGQLVGTTATRTVVLESCGTTSLTVSGLSLDPGGAEDFALSLGGAVLPLSIPPGGTAAFLASFTPNGLNPFDADGVVIPDAATLVVESDAFHEMVEIPLEGAGVESLCPEPVLLASASGDLLPSGVELPVGTALTFDASESTAPYGPVLEHLWSVAAPPASDAWFLPGAKGKVVVFPLDVPGPYTFFLRAVDMQYLPKSVCPPSSFSVAAVFPETAPADASPSKRPKLPSVPDAGRTPPTPTSPGTPTAPTPPAGPSSSTGAPAGAPTPAITSPALPSPP